MNLTSYLLPLVSYSAVPSPLSPPRPHSGRGVRPRPVPGGGRLGPQELLSGGGRAHADGLSHSHHPLQADGDPQEVGQE